jgi:ribose transport system substrate-binding protein
VAQLLPSLPKIDAVIQQGGEGYGVAQAFQAAGRPVPIIVMGNRTEELNFWNSENKKNGYQTISLSANPGIGASAVYVGYAIADGQKVPKSMIFPNLQINPPDLKDYLNLPTGGVASKSYDLTWTQQNILNQ